MLVIDMHGVLYELVACTAGGCECLLGLVGGNVCLKRTNMLGFYMYRVQLQTGLPHKLYTCTYK